MLGVKVSLGSLVVCEIHGDAKNTSARIILRFNLVYMCRPGIE